MAFGGLGARLLAAGARTAGDGDPAMAVDFGDPEGEYKAARGAAALAVLAPRATVEVTGSDRTSFLQGMLTADIAALAPGSGCRALLLTHQGRVVADLRVLAVPDRFVLQLDREVRERALSHLARFIVADDVEAVDRTAEVTTLGVFGPRAGDIFSAATGERELPRDTLAHREVQVAGASVRALADAAGEVPGVALLCPAAAAGEVWNDLLHAGCPFGLRPCGGSTLELLRIEGGMPRVGVDMDEGSFALEVGLDVAISSSKGCYLGQEVVERARSRGHINRRLCGLVLEAGEPLPPGAPVVAGGREAGRVTSSARSPGLGAVVALAYLRREHWAVGTPVTVVAAGAVRPARVAALPFPAPAGS